MSNAGIAIVDYLRCDDDPSIYSKPSRELSDTVRTYSQEESNASVAESIDEACRRVALR